MSDTNRLAGFGPRMDPEQVRRSIYHMADKELLELAAGTVGAKWDKWCGFWALDGEEWNPLEDDSDAFRLAIQLDMGIRVSPYPGAYEVASRDPARGGKCDAVAVTIRVSPKKAYLLREDFGEDRYAATRRAIAIAAVAWAMKEENENTERRGE